MKDSTTSDTSGLLTIHDYLDLKEELRSRILGLIPRFVQTAYFYGSMATGDISPGLSDPDVYVILKTQDGELSPHAIKKVLSELWDLAIHPTYKQVWGTHWIHFDTDINIDKTLANPLALLTYLFRSEFIGGDKVSFAEPDYHEILIWMRDFMAPSDEKEQLLKWLLSTRVIQGPKGLFYLIDSTVFHLGAWVAVAQRKFPRTHTEAYELLASLVSTSRDYVDEIAQIRGNWYANNDFGKVLDVYLEGVERIPKFEKELLKKLY